MHWKPAKAFLLDERNALVQEVSIDPACDVAYQDLAAAQAFAALGAPVRIGRYVAQTVRAGGLSLTVVTPKPAEEETMEFLRRLLADLPRRLDGAARDRLDLAGREEARLAARAADVAARAQGVAQLQETLLAAHARIASEAVGLKARSEAVAAAEASVRAQEAAHSGVAAKAESLVVREAEAARREEAALAMERALKEREEEIAAREKESEAFFEELAAKVAKNARWEKELARKAESLKARAASEPAKAKAKH